MNKVFLLIVVLALSVTLAACQPVEEALAGGGANAIRVETDYSKQAVSP